MADTSYDTSSENLIQFVMHFDGEIPAEGLDADEVASVADGVAKAFQFIAEGAEQNRHHKLHLREVRSGSATFQFILEVGAITQAILPAIPEIPIKLKDIGTIFGQAVKLLEFLKGQPPAQPPSITGDGNVTVVNSTGNVFHVHNITFQVAGTPYIQDQIAKTVKPLRKPRRRLEIDQNGKKIHATGSDEYRSIVARPIKSDAPLKSNTIEATLKVKQPHLDNDNSWKFKWGRNVITAKITDKNFMNDVLPRNETFRSGDILRVKLRIEEQKKGRSVSKRHFIDEVISREAA